MLPLGYKCLCTNLVSPNLPASLTSELPRLLLRVSGGGVLQWARGVAGVVSAYAVGGVWGARHLADAGRRGLFAPQSRAGRTVPARETGSADRRRRRRRC